MDAVEGTPQFHIWPSIRIVETVQADDFTTWSPLQCSGPFSAARYHLLPYFARFHWQLAVFDRSQQVIARYDSAWQDGTDRLTFTILQNWLDSNGGNPYRHSYEYTIVKATPVPTNAHDTGIVVLWVAKQLLYGKDLDNAPVDWEPERSSAMEPIRVEDDFDDFIDYD
ncbi:hypothetical protein LTR29_017633 [Friedmanniomyces endolithicus]|nr:hypothetical protein LTS09_017920 [Friedmanniomyces endolithicus]KAK0302782.1 hypothetical protein LTR01_008549 [Friedmanniomyces endolithicus]KAK0822597.1 hypothetical protein LTR73_009194 [Friedmanniomyces endolithicus]KAK0927445.1 hypothetical protein LTR29_017633 [Friedmanniomyces endolithicus]